MHPRHKSQYFWSVIFGLKNAPFKVEYQPVISCQFSDSKSYLEDLNRSHVITTVILLKAFFFPWEYYLWFYWFMYKTFTLDGTLSHSFLIMWHLCAYIANKYIAREKNLKLSICFLKVLISCLNSSDNYIIGKHKIMLGCICTECWVVSS